MASRLDQTSTNNISSSIGHMISILNMYKLNFTTKQFVKHFITDSTGRFNQIVLICFAEAEHSTDLMVEHLI